jgi:hypothetical protein
LFQPFLLFFDFLLFLLFSKSLLSFLFFTLSLDPLFLLFDHLGLIQVTGVAKDGLEGGDVS